MEIRVSGRIGSFVIIGFNATFARPTGQSGGFEAGTSIESLDGFLISFVIHWLHQR